MRQRPPSSGARRTLQPMLPSPAGQDGAPRQDGVAPPGGLFMRTTAPSRAAELQRDRDSGRDSGRSSPPLSPLPSHRSPRSPQKVNDGPDRIEHMRPLKFLGAGAFANVFMARLTMAITYYTYFANVFMARHATLTAPTTRTTLTTLATLTTLTTLSRT